MRGVLIALCVVTAVLLRPADAKKKPEKYVPAGGRGSADVGHYNHIFDLLFDHARKTCARLVLHVKRTNKKFDPDARCDLFVEAVEEMASGTGDQIVNAMATSQEQLLIWAQKTPHFGQMKGFLKKAAKYAIQKKNPTDREIRSMLSKDFNQWFLNIGTKQAGQSNGMDKLTPEHLKALRKQGINLPGGDDDEDDDDIILEDGTVDTDKGRLNDLLEDEIYGN